MFFGEKVVARVVGGPWKSAWRSGLMLPMTGGSRLHDSVCSVCFKSILFPSLGRKVIAGIVWGPWKLAPVGCCWQLEGLNLVIGCFCLLQFHFFMEEIAATMVGGPWKQGWTEQNRCKVSLLNRGSKYWVKHAWNVSNQVSFKVHKACKSVQSCSLWGRLWLEFSEGHKYWHGHLKHQVGCC